MKALIISSLLFFSLRAMSDVGEDKKGECTASVQSNKREAKVIDVPVEATKEEAKKTISK